jgi:hypothetical protein
MAALELEFLKHVKTCVNTILGPFDDACLDGSFKKYFAIEYLGELYGLTIEYLGELYGLTGHHTF